MLSRYGIPLLCYVPFTRTQKDNSNSSDSSNPSNPSNSNKQRVLVIGNGIASNAFLKDLNRNKYDVSVIAPNDTYLNTPKLIHNFECKLLNLRNINVSRLLLKLNSTPSSVLKNSLHSYDKFYRGYCHDVNTIDKKIIYTLSNDINMQLKHEESSNSKDSEINQEYSKYIDSEIKQDIANRNPTAELKTMDYDKLVIATGSEINTFGIPGVKENCLFFKNNSDMQTLISSVDQADSIYIIGSGPIGTELSFVLSKTNKPIYLIESLNRVLPQMSDKTSTSIHNEMKKYGIYTFTNTKVLDISKDEINCKINSNTTDDICLKIKRSSKSIIIWACGIKQNVPLYKFNPNNILYTVSSNLTVKKDVYLIGDSNMKNPTAQSAVQQGRYLAQVFNTGYDDPFIHYDYGKVLHTRDNIYYENNLFSIKLPLCINDIIEYIIDNRY